MRNRFPWLLMCLASLVLGGPISASPLPKAKPVSLKELERKPDSFLGNRIVVEAELTAEVKPTGSVVELTVLADSKPRQTRLRFLAPKSLADQLAGLDGAKPALLLGTVTAPESARSGYSFEVEEITLPKADGEATVLKPTAISPPPAETTTPPPEKVESPATPTKTSETGKKSEKVPTLLLVVAIGLALFLTTAMVVGIRLLKHMKTMPAKSR